MWLMDHWIPFALFLSSIMTLTTGEEGIDVSHYQGTVDWARVKAAGISFAIAKASEGSSYEDPTYVQNCQGMKSNAIKTGAYHYLRGAIGAQAQVAKFKEVLAKCNPDVVVVDVEQGSNEGVSTTQMADTLHGVLEGLKDSFNDIYIYTGPSYWEDNVDWKKYDFSQYKLWIAHYTSRSSPTIPSTWKAKGYTWWQYTDKGNIDGVNGHVDKSKTTCNCMTWDKYLDSLYKS